MEQALLKAITNGTVDEVDMDMIKSRLIVAGKALDKVCHDFAKRISELYEQYETEYKLLKSTVAFYYKDKLYESQHPEPGDFEIEMLHGHGRYFEEIRDILNKENFRHDPGRIPEDATKRL